MKRYFTYIVSRDYGFAPNPFGNYCTLATCKAALRNSAHINDWIFGTGAKKNNSNGKLVFAMNISMKLTYNEYWENPDFQYKKPVMNGSLKQMYGDNIYYFDSKKDNWHQENSHHSYEDGGINYINLNRDTRYPYVLIANEFFYFGRESISINKDIINDICHDRQGYKFINAEIAIGFIQWLRKEYHENYFSDPLHFNRFDRYDGK